MELVHVVPHQVVRNVHHESIVQHDQVVVVHVIELYHQINVAVHRLLVYENLQVEQQHHQ